MTMALLRTVEPALPSPEDIEAAQEASRALARFTGKGCVHVQAAGDGEARQSFVLPAAAVALLTDVLAGLAQGRRVVVMPENAELTTQQAADMLNVSRPYLIGVLEAGKLAFHHAGTHRRILLRDILAYRKAQQAQSAEALRQLAADAQELGLGY